MAWRLGEVMNDNHKHDKYLPFNQFFHRSTEQAKTMSHNSGPIVEFYYDVSNDTSFSRY